MAGWKKIATLFALSTSLGILGVACSTPVEDRAAAPDTTDPTDEPQALDDNDSEAAEAVGIAHPNPGREGDRDHGRDWDRERERREYERCTRRCDERFHSCLRGAYGRDDGFGRERDHRRRERCEHERFSCRSYCRNRRD